MLFIPALKIGKGSRCYPVNRISRPGRRGFSEVPDTYSTIQGAVNAAGQGDVIQVRTGTYNESIYISTDNLTLVLIDGPGKAVLRGSSVTAFSGLKPGAIPDGGATVYIGPSFGVIIDGFSITPGSVLNASGIVHTGGNPANAVTIKNNSLDGFTSYGFHGVRGIEVPCPRFDRQYKETIYWRSERGCRR